MIKKNKVDEYELVLYNVIKSIDISYGVKDPIIKKMVDELLDYLEKKSDDGIKKDIISSELVEIIEYED